MPNCTEFLHLSQVQENPMIVLCAVFWAGFRKLIGHLDPLQVNKQSHSSAMVVTGINSGCMQQRQKQRKTEQMKKGRSIVY